MDCVSVIFSDAQAKSMLKKNLYFEKVFKDSRNYLLPFKNFWKAKVH